ncbi:FimV/HubP family polar landmark protein [Psychrobacter vallis]|uniref:FimV/HubP family polar landmark protein n=1 Tax=Psychrobacter vallis TaxID=248451 RepID=UPI001918208D|nr:FimV/HubP family polar landmark protein [Psychrobacter vallis]
MDNMLYIIAGLVLILLVAGLVLRKNKAQKPSVPPHVIPTQNAATQNTTTKKNYDTPAPSHTDDNKFDPIMIAQRFMDQQRYDKAIETLNRGLNEKPNDSQLSLKLLSIYATIDQPESFNTVYEAIKAHNDSDAIARANELKGLYFEEQNSVFAQEVPAEDNTNFESIDFDLPPPPTQIDNNKTQSEQASAENSSRPLINESVETPVLSNERGEIDSTTDNVEDDFDLTLSDFENDFDEPATTATSLDMSDDKSFDTPTTDSTDAIEDTDISDFDFSFDISEADNAPSEPSVTSNTAESATETMASDHEEFILDFDDLTTDADENTEKSIVEAVTVDTTQNIEDDFTLSLEDFDEADNSNSTETVLENEKPTLEQSHDIDNFVLEDSSFEDHTLDDTFQESNLKESSLEDSNFEPTHLEEQSFDEHNLESSLTESSSITPTAPLLFDDNTLLDDDFEAGSSVATTPEAPVEIDTNIATEADVETPDDFSARFAADFDFVKSLDSNQVTLDLAGQYLQLGEYDSAKRLLTEVITQGNSEQQKQAQLLLERTA